MPIDEAEGLGSNYEMLHALAQKENYQIITMSIETAGNVFANGDKDNPRPELRYAKVGSVQKFPARVIAGTDFCDLAGKATVGHNFVTLGDGTEHLLGFFGALHLRTDQHEVEKDDQNHQRQELEQGARLLRGRLGVSRAKNKIQHLRLRLPRICGSKN